MTSLIAWRPLGTLWDWDVDEIFAGFMEPMGTKSVPWAPRVESFRKNGSYVIKADLPGVEAKDIQVTVENGCLTIKGERKMDKEVKNKDLLRREVFYGSFERSIAVPEDLKVEEMKAKYHDGVLEIFAPVEEPVQPKKIEVEAEKS
jgi:HSP20 family protein